MMNRMFTTYSSNTPAGLFRYHPAVITVSCLAGSLGVAERLSAVAAAGLFLYDFIVRFLLAAPFVRTASAFKELLLILYVLQRLSREPRLLFNERELC